MMKTRIVLTALALSITATVACFGASAQLGTWKLNEAKSKIAPGMGKHTTGVYTEQKDKIKVTVEGVDGKGKAAHGVWVGKFDGKTYPEKGNVAFDAVAYKMVNE